MVVIGVDVDSGIGSGSGSVIGQRVVVHDPDHRDHPGNARIPEQEAGTGDVFPVLGLEVGLGQECGVEENSASQTRVGALGVRDRGEMQRLLREERLQPGLAERGLHSGGQIVVCGPQMIDDKKWSEEICAAGTVSIDREGHS